MSGQVDLNSPSRRLGRVALSYGLGARVRRREDPRLVTGAGTYLDDLRPSGLAHLVFIRSSLPHAAIAGIDASEARKAPGVIAVVTAADLEGVATFPVSGPRGSHLPPRPLLNDRQVSFAGDLIAFVVADTREQARDAADLITVELDSRSVVVDANAASQAAVIHEALQTNVADESKRIWGEGEAAFGGAHRVVRARIRNQRLAGFRSSLAA
jgi:aerobic carbon-monoxide dehydrogenase large subunit